MSYGICRYFLNCGSIWRVDKIFLFLFLLLIPTQLGKHWWPGWSGVNGIRVDYLAPTLYLVDLVWLAWIGAKLLGSLKTLKLLKWERVFNFKNLMILLFVGVNVVIASNRWVAVYKWLRVGQWWITYIQFKNLEFKNLKNYLRLIIPCWVVVEAFLAIGQVVTGHSLGGIFYWLGERRFNLNTIGIAQMSWWGQSALRAYGTFSHPNSLAGFMLILWLLWDQNPSVRLGRTSPPPRRAGLEKGRNTKTIWWWVVNWLMILVMGLAGSRTVWLLMATKLLITIKTPLSFGHLPHHGGQALKKGETLRHYVGWGVVGVGIGLIILGYWGNKGNWGIVGGWDREGVQKRWELVVAAGKMIKSSPLFGVGAGNFLVELPKYQLEQRFYWLQPVHNIFLLGWSEIGMVGIIIIFQLTVTSFQLRVKNKKNFWILGVILVTGIVDHYWLTLPQNSWLLAVVLAIQSTPKPPPLTRRGKNTIK